METNGPTHKLGLCSIDVIEKNRNRKKQCTCSTQYSIESQ